MKDLFKVILTFFIIISLNGCGDDSTGEKAKDNELSKNTSGRHNIPMLSEDISDKYMGFEIEEEILIEELKLDDEILNILLIMTGILYYRFI